MLVAHHDQKLSLRARDDLLVEAQSIVLLLGCLRIGSMTLFHQPLRLFFELLNLGKIGLVLVGLEEGLTKLGSRSWDAILPAIFDMPLMIIGNSFRSGYKPLANV